MLVHSLQLPSAALPLWGGLIDRYPIGNLRKLPYIVISFGCCGAVGLWYGNSVPKDVSVYCAVRFFIECCIGIGTAAVGAVVIEHSRSCGDRTFASSAKLQVGRYAVEISVYTFSVFAGGYVLACTNFSVLLILMSLVALACCVMTAMIPAHAIEQVQQHSGGGETQPRSAENGTYIAQVSGLIEWLTSDYAVLPAFAAC